jgi:hypothetical protein
VLREIALLRYKSPTLVVSGERLALLDQDLARLAVSGASRPQIAALREVCAKAVADGCALTVSGDMYPELWRPEASPSSSVSRYVVGLIAPWLILCVGTVGLMAFRDDNIAESLWYLLRIVCMCVILGLLVASIWSLILSAPRRRSAWTWGFLLCCFVNVILFGKVGWR